MPRPTPLILALLFLFTAASARAHSSAEAAQAMSDAATAWVASLATDQQGLGVMEFTQDERENWHYIPKTRLGLPLAKMNESQRKLARALLASGLSQHGVLQAESVMALERVLRELEKSDRRDETLYFFTVFGKPAATGAWGWRFEGHHLSVNFTIVNGRISATPNFVGSNPGEVRVAGPQQGQRALAGEEDAGRALVLSLDDAQRAKAVVSDKAPGDILTRNDRQTKSPGPEGLSYAALTPTQQTKFRDLVAIYANRLRAEVANDELEKIKTAGWDRLSFAWAGSTKPGDGHYYRIQGPAFVIEYDNTQNNANHVHTVWRVYDGDFGRDLLQEHYRADHGAKRP